MPFVRAAESLRSSGISHYLSDWDVLTEGGWGGGVGGVLNLPLKSISVSKRAHAQTHIFGLNSQSHYSECY